jgi:carbon storage regulator
MLVLTRKSQQEIVIAEDIRVTILEVGGGRVKIGVTAPDDVRIRRCEVPARFVERESGTQLSVNSCSWRFAALAVWSDFSNRALGFLPGRSRGTALASWRIFPACENARFRARVRAIAIGVTVPGTHAELEMPNFGIEILPRRILE